MGFWSCEILSDSVIIILSFDNKITLRLTDSDYNHCTLIEEKDIYNDACLFAYLVN